jgi:hypothetical protein
MEYSMNGKISRISKEDWAQLHLGIESALNGKSQVKLKDEEDERSYVPFYFSNSYYWLQRSTKKYAVTRVGDAFSDASI